MAEPVRVAYLAEASAAIPALAAGFKAEWAAHYADRTVADIAADFSAWLHRDRLPLALVALAGVEVCGTVTLRSDSLTTHPHLRPWVAAFYVSPSRRRAGIGARLLHAALGEAQRLGFGAVYAASGSASSLFLRTGWVPLERLSYHGAPLVLFRRALEGAV